MAELIKASPLQRDQQFIKWLNNGQRRYKRFIKEAKATTEWSDIEIVDHYIIWCDIVIGIFNDADYELG